MNRRTFVTRVAGIVSALAVAPNLLESLRSAPKHVQPVGLGPDTQYDVYATYNTSLRSGDWEDPTIWSMGHVPISFKDRVSIQAGHTVTLHTSYGTPRV